MKDLLDFVERNPYMSLVGLLILCVTFHDSIASVAEAIKHRRGPKE